MPPLLRQMPACACGCGGMVSSETTLFCSGHRTPYHQTLVEEAKRGSYPALQALERFNWLTPDARRFGIEIEFFGVRYDFVCTALQDAGLGPIVYHDGVHHETLHSWKLVRDRSVNARGSGSDSRGLELVSPPLMGSAGRSAVQVALATLRTIGARVDTTCGLHIHHSAKDLDVETIRRIVLYYTRMQDALNTILPASRHASEFCQIYSTSWLDRLFSPCLTIEALALAIDFRYMTVNLMCYPKYRTIEFRQHHGTLDLDVALNWLALTQGIMRLALHTRALRLPQDTLPAFLNSLWLTSTQRQHYMTRAAHLAADPDWNVYAPL